MLVVPCDVPAWAYCRFGHVSPGTEANQLVRSAYCFARNASTGTSESGKHFMISSGLARIGPGERVIQLHTRLNRAISVAPSRSHQASGRSVPCAICRAYDLMKPVI